MDVVRRCARSWRPHGEYSPARGQHDRPRFWPRTFRRFVRSDSESGIRWRDQTRCGNNPNSDDRSYNENERSNDINLDQFFVRWKPNDTTSVLLGKSVFPLELTPMVWDSDLRPIGASAETSISVNSLDRLQFTVGYFAGDLLYGDDSRIG